MFAWLLPNVLAKASIDDGLPDGVQTVLVAAEYSHADAWLVDEGVAHERQQMEFKRAVSLVLRSIDAGAPVVVTCQQGRSRSVTVACVAAAIYEGTSFRHQYQGVFRKDRGILVASPLWVVAQVVYPELFTETQEGVNDGA